jgi:hypothetical protein
MMADAACPFDRKLEDRRVTGQNGIAVFPLFVRLLWLLCIYFDNGIGALAPEAKALKRNRLPPQVPTQG